MKGGDPLYVVHYLCVRARAEPIHLLLKYAKVPYTRHDFSFEAAGNKEHKTKFPSSQLPVRRVGINRKSENQKKNF